MRSLCDLLTLLFLHSLVLSIDTIVFGKVGLQKQAVSIVWSEHKMV